MLLIKSQYLSGYFDTNIGLKSEVASYEKIAKEIDQPVESVLFLTDNPKGQYVLISTRQC